MPPVRVSSRSKAGFSLIELMSVVAISALVFATAAPALSGLTWVSGLNKNLLVLSGVLQQARQYAISKNTYAWVVFSMPSSSASLDSPIKVGLVASMDGTDVLGWSG